MDRGWMYCLKAPDPKFVNGVDSFVKTAQAYCVNKLKDDDHVYCPCVATIRKNFATSSKSVVIYWLGVLWQTIRFGISMEKTGRTYNMILHGMIPSKKPYTSDV